MKKAYRSCQKHTPRACRHPLSTGRHLLGVLFVSVTNGKLNLRVRPAVNIQKTAKHNITNLHVQDTTELQFNAFLTENHQLLIINIQLFGFLPHQRCQGQR